MTENPCDLEEKCPNWPDCDPDCMWWKFACERYNEALKDVLLDENLWLKWNDREYVKAYLRALEKKVKP